MQASIDADIIQEALRIAQRLSPSLTGNITLESDGRRLYLHSVADLSRCRILLPCKVTGECLFAVPTAALTAAVKGRKTLNFTYGKTVLNIQSGSYKLELTTVDAIQAEEQAQGEGEVWELTAEHLAWLKQALSAVALKPTANIIAYMPVSIRLTAKSSFIACYDEQHMAYTTTKEVTGDLSVTLPLDTLSAVVDTFGSHPCKMQVTGSALFLKNKILDVQLALPEGNGTGVTADEVFEKAKEASAAEGHKFVVPKKTLSAFLENARAVATKERMELGVGAETGLIKMTVTTANGTAKAKSKAAVKSEFAFKVDYDYFDEALKKCQDEVHVKLVDDAFLAFKTSSSTVLVALNQDS